MIDVAVESCRADGTLRNCINGAIERRALGSYFHELYHKTTCYEDIVKLKEEVPPGTPFEYEWQGKTITVGNHAFGWDGPIKDFEKEQDARCWTLPAVAQPAVAQPAVARPAAQRPRIAQPREHPPSAAEQFEMMMGLDDSSDDDEPLERSGVLPLEVEEAENRLDQLAVAALRAAV